MLALIFMGCIQNRTRAIRGFGKSDSDVSNDMIPPLFRGHCFQITFCNLVPCSPCLGPYTLLATVSLCTCQGLLGRSSRRGAGRMISNSRVHLRFWLSGAHLEPLSSFLNVEGIFSPRPRRHFWNRSPLECEFSCQGWDRIKNVAVILHS